jgi:hypothetical protein
MTILIGGQRFRTACASFKPSILPGISMSYQRDVCPMFEYNKRFVGISSLDGYESGLMHDVNSEHPNQIIVFNHQDNLGKLNDRHSDEPRRVHS